MMLRLYLIMGCFWAAWNRKMEPMLSNSQLADGSWPKEGSGKLLAGAVKMLKFIELLYAL